MLIEEIVTQVGFPIAVVIYLLYVQATTIKENTKALHKLREALIKLEAKLNG